MRTSIHRGFSHPMGGVSPMKQEKDMVTASDGASVPSANLEDYENSLKQAKKDIAKEEVNKFYSKPLVNEDVLNVLPLSGEVVDAKNTVKDLIAGDYSGAALNASGFAIPFIPGSFVKGSVKKLMDYIRKQPGAKDAIKKGEKILKERGPTGVKPKGGVDGGSIKVDKNYKYKTFDIKTTPRSVTDATNVKGTDLDNWITSVKEDGMDFSKMDYSRSITKLPNKSDRPFVKVDLPNGGEQIFYRSTGTGGKAGSKGEWIPFEGFRADGWFVKTGSKGKFAGKNIETIFTHHNKAGDVISKADWIKQGKQKSLVNSHGVYEQIQQLGLDPWEEIAKGNLKIDKWGQGFKYGSKEYTKIAEQLKNMDL